MATVAHAAWRQQPARSGGLPQPPPGRAAAAGRERPQDGTTPATTPEVDAIGALPFTGTLIPHAWYTALTLPSGKPDLVAITLLADIVYWYRPVVERDSATGQVLGQRKKFRGDMLQRSYQAFADQFGFTKRQVMEAMYRLEKTYGAIRKDLRHLDTPYGRCANVLFVAPIPARLRAMTCEGETSHAALGDVSRSVGTRLTRPWETNTEILPETSPEISPLEDDFSSLFREEAEEGVDEEAEVTTDEEEVPAEQTAAPPARDTPLPAEDASPPASPAVVVPLFPGRGARPRQHRTGPCPSAAPALDTPRSPTLPVSAPAPALPWWPATQQAQQEEAHLRAQVAVLPVAEHAQLTQQARQVLTRQGVPAWMQIGPVVEAAMWELLRAPGVVRARSTPMCDGGCEGRAPA